MNNNKTIFNFLSGIFSLPADIIEKVFYVGLSIQWKNRLLGFTCVFNKNFMPIIGSFARLWIEIQFSQSY